MEACHQDALERQPETHLLDFDNGVLLQVLKHLTPLPDLFNVAQACWRFRQLTSDKRMWLLVAPNHLRPDQTPSGRPSGPVYSSLSAAVASSRPGDTIWLAPGMSHSVTDVRIRFPIHLRGGGSRPEDTLLTCAKGSEAALDFAATAKLANLSIQSHMAPCVLHRRGGLRVERCVLQCRADGLEHLLAPLVTVAAGGGIAAGGGTAAITAQSSTILLAPPVEASLLPMPALQQPPAAICTQPGIGRLSVVESRLEGGSRAVQCFGTGRLMGVRVIYEAHAAFFWLEVDSAVPGQYNPGAAVPGLRRYTAVGTAAASGAVTARMPLIKQQQQQQQQLGVLVKHEEGQAPAAGLARIQSVLGKRINPDVLSAHLQSRSLRQHGPAAEAVVVKQETEL